MKRFWSIVCLVVWLVTLQIIPAFADDEVKVLNAKLLPENELELLVQVPAEVAVPTDAITVTLGKENLPVKQSVVYADMQQGTSWIFVVDKQQGESQGRLKALLTDLTEIVGPLDNAAILPAGAEQKDIALISNTVALRNQITEDLLKRNTSIHTFYHTANEALTYLETAQDVKPRAVLVLVSPGTNKNEEKATSAQVADHAKDSVVAVYTVALMHSGTSEAKVKSFHDIANSLAISSESSDSKAKMDEYASQISANEKHLHVMRCDVSTLKGEISDSLVFSINLNGLKTAGFVLPADLMEQLKTGVAPTPAPTVDPTPTPTNSPIPFPLNTETLVLIAGGVVVLLMIILIIVLVKRNKPAQVISVNVDELKPNGVPDEHHETMLEEDAPLRVTLTPVKGSAGVRFDQDMTSELIIGREPGENGLVIPEEEQYKLISRLHLRLFRKGDVIFAENLSRNGTTINGARVDTTPAMLHENDRITMGRIDFLITWHRIG